MTSPTRLGQAGLQGWRVRVGDAAARPVSSKTPLDEDQVRAIVGAAFFVLAVLYVAKTVAALVQEARRT